jgi:siderophore synthetase component
MTSPSSSARKVAANASFQAFVNCYLREVDPGTWHRADSWQASTGVRPSQDASYVVEVALPSQRLTLAVEIRFRSLVGRHAVGALHRRIDAHAWEPVDGVSAQLLLVQALYAAHPQSEQHLQLLARVIESNQVMACYVEHALAQPTPDATRRGFLASERAVELGHWLHPTPKSRLGMLDWHHAHYAPELGGEFQLHYFAAARALVQQDSLLELSAEALSRRLALQAADDETARRIGALEDAYCILPLHPLQAHWLLHQDYVRRLLAERRLIDLGRLGPSFTPTSSVRTLYAEQADLMVKVSIPVKITNSLRINLQSELGDSVWVSQLLRRCGVGEAFPLLQALEDPAYISLALPEREESGFEVIFRANPFQSGHEHAVHSVAALVQDPLREGARSCLEQLVRRVADAHELELGQASLRWFDAYWECAIEAPIRIYDRHGIALEAHQQNVLLELSTAGMPCRSYYRDIQGIGLSVCFREELLALVPELAQQTKVFEPDEIVRDGLGYYLVFNQLIAVINRFALDGLLDEASLLAVVRRKLHELKPSLRELGQAFVDGLLEARTIPCKGNLLTRVADMDELQAENELAVYTQVDNPFREPPTPSAARAARAIAEAFEGP